MSNYTIDLNCDMGEGFGAFQMGNDDAIMPFVTSANIACGFHAGDPGIMKRTVKSAIKHGVAIGAHPGLPDIQGFGRRNMAISEEDAYDMVLYQVGALQAFVHAEGGVLHHVKPHGALYNMAAVKASLADAIAEAIYAVSPGLILYGLAESELIAAADRIGLASAREIFADRAYEPDGTLRPRHLPGALITEPAAAVLQVKRLIHSRGADTLCIHGDGSHALEFVKTLHQNFEKEGILMESPQQNRS